MVLPLTSVLPPKNMLQLQISVVLGHPISLIRSLPLNVNRFFPTSFSALSLGVCAVNNNRNGITIYLRPKINYGSLFDDIHETRSNSKTFSGFFFHSITAQCDNNIY